MRFGTAGSSRAQRGFSLLEALIAIVILMIAFLVWSSAMITATDGENKAGNHTEAIGAANEVLESIRRDPNFWSSEYNAGSCPQCWAVYNDTFGTSPLRSCQSIPNPQGMPANCNFNWRATRDASSVDLADLTVIVQIQGANHQIEKYTVMGMDRKI